MAALLATLVQPLLQSLAQLLLAGLQQRQAHQDAVALGAAEQSAAALSLSLTAAKARTDAETTAGAAADPVGRLLHDWSRPSGA